MARHDMMPGPFADAFREASMGESAFETWQRFVYVAARDIAVAVCQDASAILDMAETAERQMERRADAYRRMFDAYVEEVESDPFRDFLGDAFMRLGIGNESGGQFFTPYHVARLVASEAVSGLARTPARGWVSAYEPACGAGANVIAACDVMGERGMDWQRGSFFYCQDVSELTALTCYVQLSLVGVAATVAVGDSLSGVRRFALHTPVAMVDDVWTSRYLRGELRHVW